MEINFAAQEQVRVDQEHHRACRRMQMSEIIQIRSISAVSTIIEPYPSRHPCQLKLNSTNGGKETSLLCHTDHIYLLHAPKAADFFKKDEQILILQHSIKSPPRPFHA